MPKNIAADTGFWFALFDNSDESHELALLFEEHIEFHQLIVPWPTLYEALNSRLARRRHEIARFKSIVERPTTLLVSDSQYRDASLARALDFRARITYSLVDHVLRSIIEDPAIKVDALITFNARDFYDVCASRGVEVLSN